MLGGDQQLLISPGCCDGSGSPLFMSSCCRTYTLSTNMLAQACMHTENERVKDLVYFKVFVSFAPGKLASIIKDAI